MPDVVFTYHWTAGLEGWNPDSTGVNTFWQSDDGSDFAGASAPGCLKQSVVTIGSGSTSIFSLMHANQTWEYWGVPAGKFVTQVTARMRARQQAGSALFTSLPGQLTMQGPPYDDTAWIYLFSTPDMRTFLGASWASVPLQSPCIPEIWSPSNTVVELEFLVTAHASPPNPGGTGYDFRFDTLELTITYQDAWSDCAAPPPSPGIGECSGPLSVNGLFPVAAARQTPYLLMARQDMNQIAMLDLYTPAAQQDIIWRTLPIDGGPEARPWKKRFRRLRVYGEGTLDPSDAGTVTFTADGGQRVETYPVTPAYSDPTQKILILQETSPDLVGRQVEVTLRLNGTGLVLREAQLEFVRLN